MPAALIVLIIIITSGGSGQSKPPPPAKLPALVQIYANPAINAAGRMPGDWSAVRGPGFLHLTSRDRKSIIEIAAQADPNARKLPLLKEALASIRKTYRSVTIKHGQGTNLGGLPARSVVLYTRNQRNVPIRILVAVAQGHNLAYVVEAFTAQSASVTDLVEAQQVIVTLRLAG